MTSGKLLDYERLGTDLWKHIGVSEEESVAVRHAFRWFKNGELLSNAYESMSIEQICEDRGWEIVTKYGDHIAIIKSCL